jgi:hypothetical protein
MSSKTVGTVARYVGAGIVVVGAIVVGVVIFHDLGVAYPAPSKAGPSLAAADVPPLEYAYLDSPRVAAYLGQLENGLAKSEERSQQFTQSVNASLSGGSVAQLGASEQAQEGSQMTVTPTAADEFYQFLRLVRNPPMAACQVNHAAQPVDACNPKHCNTGARKLWLGDINDQSSSQYIMGEVACIGVGNFVRISHAQLFTPSFAQALPRAESANAFYGELPAARRAFTSPAQSTGVRAGLARYTKLAGLNPRLPFVAAPYGFDGLVGSGVKFFLPVHYASLTVEPALLSGSVTIVGKIIYYAGAGPSYIDYPTLDDFDQPLSKENKGFLNSLGVCSRTTPRQARPEPTRKSPRGSPCNSRQQTLNAVKTSVTFRPPVVVVLPVAIYQ